VARDRIGGAHGHRIDQMSGEQRHEQIGDGGAKQAAGNRRHADRLTQPMAKHEGQHHADRRGALAGLVGHGIARLRSRAGRLHRVDERRQGRAQASLKNDAAWKLT
jgi:hypothetical protein